MAPTETQRLHKVRLYVQKRVRRFLPAARLSDEHSADLYLNYVPSGAIGVLSGRLESELP